MQEENNTNINENESELNLNVDSNLKQEYDNFSNENIEENNQSNEETNTSETYVFQAEIAQLMSLIINTFYSNKDIFLRELISNSSDALDKIRHLSLTNSELLGTQEKLFINIIPNKDNNTLTILDSGIGMTKTDLINNLGTIAKSGTKAFMQAMTSGADMSMIGQFGVGFYSAFLVANEVDVITKHTDDSCYKWSSSAGGSFSISPCEELTRRSTSIVLHLKDDQLEYLEESKLKEIINKHSQFINYPISLMVNKEREVEVASEEDDENDENDETETQESVKVEEVDEEKKVDKKIEQYQELEELNKTKPLWTRKPEDVTQEEYSSFYKSYTNDWDEHLAVKHFNAEGQIEFKSILYIPKRPPFDLYENNKKKNLKLYVRRVFITDNCDDLMPDYLNFIKGLVDSEDLPLNISREILQQSRILKTIKKTLVKKSIELMEELTEDNEKFTNFYQNFSKNIKLGIHEDTQNRERLAKLLRYQTSTSEEKFVSLEDYVKNMKENQTDIYYIIGENIKDSSFVKGITDKGYEVILMTDPIDEYCVQQLNSFDGHNLVCITRDGFELPSSEEEKNNFKTLIEDYKSTCEYIKNILSDRVENVSVSDKVGNVPFAIVTGQHGWSANMERLMKAQALRDSSTMNYMTSKKHLQINPNHDIIKAIRRKMNTESEKQMINNLVGLLYDTSLLTSGFTLENPTVFAAKMTNMIQIGLGIESEDEPNENISNDTLDNTQSADNTESTVQDSPELEDTNLDNEEEMEQVD